MPNYNSTLQSNNTDLQAILNTINELPQAGGQQATPVISINSTNGLITATAGTKSSTHQLAFQPAKTITPSTASQIAVSSGYYTGGAITVAGDSDLVASNIKSGVNIFGVTGTYAGSGGDPFANANPFTYTVNAISGASHGFAINNAGYYESQNKGVDSSYAICRVNLTVTNSCDIVFDVINYAESNYDYALFGNLDSALTLSSTADSSVKKNFKGQQSASVVNVTYSGVSIGSHYIDIKFIKDSSQSKDNDSVQFKIQEQSGLSQETINKILAADNDLVAGNIKSGVNIFGVTGTYVGSGEGNASIEAALLFPQGSSLTTYSNSVAKTIGSSVFNRCSSLISVNFPNVTTIYGNAFYSCKNLTTISFPKANNIYYSAFANCSALKSAVLPAVSGINQSVFCRCISLSLASFAVASSIASYAFYMCTNLSKVYLESSKVATLSNSNAFSSTPIGGYSTSAGTYGSIYVPASLLKSYKAATNWVYFSSRFVGI